MTTRDSGLIDLFAIHKEEEARLSAVPSAPPPAVALDLPGVSDDEIEGFAEAQARSRKRTKVIGGVLGGLAVVGVVVGAIFLGGGAKEAPTSAAAQQPPPLAETAPPPPAATPEPAPPPTPPPPATAKAEEKPEYTRAAAIAAYNAQQRKAKGSPAPGHRPAAKPIGGGIKLQKVQSSGVAP